MLKRVLPSALTVAALGVAAAGYPVPDFAQDLPARCLPQEHDGCNDFVRFGMSGPMIIPGQALSVDATGSINRDIMKDAVEPGSDSPQ
jgi:hypothetical protein